jgi:hypothetical protein
VVRSLVLGISEAWEQCWLPLMASGLLFVVVVVGELVKQRTYGLLLAGLRPGTVLVDASLVVRGRDGRSPFTPQDVWSVAEWMER